MADIMRIKLEGGERLEAALKDLGGKVAGRLGTNAVRAGARVISNEAKDRVPVKTGALRRSIRVFDDRAAVRANLKERTAFVGTRLFYGKFVELGTAHSSAKPFLRPAMDESGDSAVDKLADNLGDGIERETAKYRSFI